MLADLPPLREVISQHGLAAKKGLGQHFLLDLNLTRKIAALCLAGQGDTILEVGPGPGGLTRSLLETGADVIAVERDRRIVPILEDLDGATGRLRWHEADALQFDEHAIVPDDTILASNLPYNISTELLVKWLLAEPRFWKRMVLMFQKEVADRILAEAGNKTYGRLSVIAQAASKPKLGFTLPARAFTPPPKVDSAVVVFETVGCPPFLRNLEKVTAAAFGQRRKMLRQSLKAVFGSSLPSVLETVGLNETVRAENVSVEQFVRLAKLL